MQSQSIYGFVCGSKAKKVDTKVMILYLLNCIPSVTKEQKLIFAFDLYDEEDSRIITIKELKKILQANYFAGSIQEVEKKSKIILDMAVTGEDDTITYDDYMALGKRLSALFFPINL